MKTDSVCAEILDDSETEDESITNLKISTNSNSNDTEKPKKLRGKIPAAILKKCYNENENVYEIGVDEVGRGPLFGRVYTAAVILPKDNSFDCSMVKDSKKFHSKKKIEEASNYIKEHALGWYISFEDEKKIDEINILQATQLSMHNSILEIRKLMIKNFKEEGREENKDYTFSLLIDGNYFKPITYLNKKTNKLESIPHVTVEGGDNKYASIAAASILAKVERDRYIDELCKEHPTLTEHYSIDSNKGYGAKKHLDGIKEHGITIWHRRSFGICKNFD
jgi:ribonuclease HII